MMAWTGSADMFPLTLRGRHNELGVLVACNECCSVSNFHRGGDELMQSLGVEHLQTSCGKRHEGEQVLSANRNSATLLSIGTRTERERAIGPRARIESQRLRDSD
jgi:hypothetical protein